MQKKTTSRDVARAAGVSQSLVSMILNRVPDKKIKAETRAHVLDIARQMNYTVNVNARNMKNRKAGAIGLLSVWDTGSFVFPPIIKGLQEICAENQLGVMICTGKEDLSGEKDYISYYRQIRIDALVYLCFVGVSYDGVIAELENNGIPYVCIIGARDIPGVSCVDVSFLESGYMACKHMAEMGYGHIAYLMPDEAERLPYAEKERIDGCRAAMKAAGKELTEVTRLAGIKEEERLIACAEELLRSKSFDGFVSCSYGCYILLKAAVRSGIRIPEEVGVISLDNEIYAPYLYPSLTTVDEPLYKMAVSAMGILLKKISGEGTCMKLEIAPSMSVRESTSRRPG